MRIRIRLPLEFAAGILLLTSCAAPPQPPTKPEPESPRAFATRFIAAEDKAWGAGDVGDLKAIESDSVIYHLPGMDLKGWKAHEDFITQGRAASSNIKQVWTYLSGDGNIFVLGYVGSAVMRPDPAKSPVSVSTDYLSAFRIQDGRIAEVWMNGSTTTK